MSTDRSPSTKPQSQPPAILAQTLTSPKKRSLAKTSPKAWGRGKRKSSDALSKKRPDFRNRNEEALKRLGLKPDCLAGVPIITHILKQSEGGLPEVIECLRGSSDEIAQKFIDKYDEVAKSDLVNGRVRVEHICVACDIDTADLLATATKAIFTQKKVTSALKLASAHPKLVDKSIQMGLQDKGVKDREMMHSAIGFLPQSSNNTNFFRKVVVNHLENPERAQEVEIPVTEDCPSMEDDILGLTDTDQKLLSGITTQTSPKVDEWSETSE